MGSLIILGIAAILLLGGISLYNRLVQLRNQVTNAWSQIDVQLQRRHDLIPNLIETVKGYMSYEKNVLESVTQARNQAVAAREALQKHGGPTESSLKDLTAAEASLRGAIGNIFAVAENYPQLKASDNMRQLQEELRTTEDRVGFARQAYNDNVMAYNTAQQSFPANMVASAFGHHPADLFQIQDEEAKKVPKVSFS